jgi:hypothetical protein
LRNLLLLSKYLGIATAIWLADTVLVCLTHQIPFIFAIWEDITPARLILRLTIVLIILFRGFCRVIKRELEYNRVMKMRQADRNALYGSRLSPDKSKRLLYYSLRLAKMLQLSIKEQDNLRTLCYCYQLGLVNTANTEQKASFGAAIAANIPQISRSARLIDCSGEFYDGSGPKALMGRAIPLSCRIFTAVLLFDDLLYNSRGYKADSPAEALNTLQMYAGTKLDPEIVEAFSRLCLNQQLEKTLTAEVYMQ